MPEAKELWAEIQNEKVGPHTRAFAQGIEPPSQVLAAMGTGQRRSAPGAAFAHAVHFDQGAVLLRPAAKMAPQSLPLAPRGTPLPLALPLLRQRRVQGPRIDNRLLCRGYAGATSVGPR